MKPSSSACRAAGAALVALSVVAGATACSHSSAGSSGGSGGSGTTYTVWDPYAQFDAKSAWAQLLDKCGSQAGVSIKRTAIDTTALTSKELLAAQQGVSPDVLVVDNPVISTLAAAGVLTTTAQTNVNTSAISANLLAAGQIDGKTYGIPIGANTLALYYNKNIIKAAGVDVSTIKDWASLTAALGKVKAIGVSNFSVKNLEILLKTAKVVPAVNQCEIHPQLPEQNLLEYCNAKGIHLTAYSPLGQYSSAIHEDKDLCAIAQKHNTTAANVALSWNVQRGVSVVPKSTNEKRMKQNITLIKLSDDEMKQIDAISSDPKRHTRTNFLVLNKEKGTILGWTMEEMGWDVGFPNL